ncbi:MAG: hypothetical protein LBB94_06925 [Clostridiales bacterium]|jgi:hypothetical protein|nr:hypothetical protein [Clostridiales bacterium]
MKKSLFKDLINKKVFILAVILITIMIIQNQTSASSQSSDIHEVYLAPGMYVDTDGYLRGRVLPGSEKISPVNSDGYNSVTAGSLPSVDN